MGTVEAPEAPVKGAEGTGNGTGTTTPTEKQYVFGGRIGAPEMGANSRRLWKYLSAHCSKKALRELRKRVLASTPDTDRFIRWQRIVAAAEAQGLTIGKGEDAQSINQALVRRLQAEDKEGKIGRDASITFTVK